MASTIGVEEVIVIDIGHPEYEGVAYSSWYRPMVGHSAPFAWRGSGIKIILHEELNFMDTLIPMVKKKVALFRNMIHSIVSS